MEKESSKPESETGDPIEVNWGSNQKSILSKPWARFLGKKEETEHESCWDCEFIRVGRQFYRICALHREKHIWSGGAESEFLDQGTTVANDCPDYMEDDRTGYDGVEGAGE